MNKIASSAFTLHFPLSSLSLSPSPMLAVTSLSQQLSDASSIAGHTLHALP
jgi:hypothetical protein